MPDFSILKTLADPNMDKIVGRLPDQQPQSQDSSGLGGLGQLLSGLGGLIGKGVSTPQSGVNPAQQPQLGLLGASQKGIGMNPQTPDYQSPQSKAAHGSFDPFKTSQPYMGMTTLNNNDALKGFMQKSGQNIDPANTPWCAAYANSVLQSSGMKGTGSLAARSFLNYGTPTKTPQRGDIVVFSDLTGNNDPAHGHVGFYAGTDGNGNIMTLGGNEGHGVAIKSYPASKVLGYRQPLNGNQIAQGIAPPNASPELPHVMQGIAHVETSDSKDPYSEVGKATNKGDRAYGKYQIMGSNIPSWSAEALGHPMTPGQFMKDPASQEKVAAYQMNKYLQNGATPQDAASMWFTGKSLNKANPNSKDAYGTTNTMYQKKFNQGYLQSKQQSMPMAYNIPNAMPGYPNVKAFDPNTPMNQLSPKDVDAIMRHLGGGMPSPIGRLANAANPRLSQPMNHYPEPGQPIPGLPQEKYDAIARHMDDGHDIEA